MISFKGTLWTETVFPSHNGVLVIGLAWVGGNIYHNHNKKPACKFYLSEKAPKLTTPQLSAWGLYKLWIWARSSSQWMDILKSCSASHTLYFSASVFSGKKKKKSVLYVHMSIPESWLLNHLNIHLSFLFRLCMLYVGWHHWPRNNSAS